MAFFKVNKTRLALATIFFTFFIDNLAFSIVFPIFAPFFIDVNNTLFSPEVSIATRTAILGVFLAAFSIGQFIGAPIIGEYADKHGRKKALAGSIFFTVLGLGVSAWSMDHQNLILLFLGRLVTGFFASNTSLCLAAIADLHEDEKKKVKHFGYFSIIVGISFLIGAFVGGKISDSSINPSFFPSLPLWLASGFSVINLLFIFFGFQETSTIEPNVRFDLLESFHNIHDALKSKKLRSIYLIYFFFIFSWTIIFQFTPVLMIRDFLFTSSSIGDLALIMGVFWAIGSGYLNKILLSHWTSLKILECSLLAFIAFSLLLIFKMHLYFVLIVIVFLVMVSGLAWPICTGVISSMAPKTVQGKILGISQSVQSLAMALAPAIGGLFYQFFGTLIFLLSAISSFIAALIYFTLKNR